MHLSQQLFFFKHEIVHKKCHLHALHRHELPFHVSKNARMQLFMSITPYTVVSIENLLFGSNNLTNEKQFDSPYTLIDLSDMKLYSVFRMLSYICRLYPFFPTTSVYQIYLCIYLSYM